MTEFDINQIPEEHKHTQHINPGTDTTINPVIINDTHRQKQQPPHPQRYLTIDSCHDCSNRMEMICLYKPLGMIPMPAGKEAFDYRNRYVCTEKGDKEIVDDLPDWCPLPHTPAHPPEAQQRIDAAITELDRLQIESFEWLEINAYQKAIALLQVGQK